MQNHLRRLAKMGSHAPNIVGIEHPCPVLTADAMKLKGFERISKEQNSILKGFVTQKVRNVSAGFQDSMIIKHEFENDQAK